MKTINFKHLNLFSPESIRSIRKLNRLMNSNTNFALKNFSSSIHVDQKDDSFFKSIKDWWDVNGTVRTLHSYNDLRIKYLKKHLQIENISISSRPFLPFDSIHFLDVGCGGGILCESLARLGGQVVGIDSNVNSYNMASTHLNNYEGEELKYMKSKLKYYHGSTDNYLQDSKNSLKYNQKFDVVTAMEVIEHVNCPRLFVKDLSILNKEGGYIFLSTINRTNMSYYGMIVGGEKLFRIVPEGTHDWNKFIKPEELVTILKENGYCLKDLTGVSYNLLTGDMNFSSDMSMNYILLAKKLT